MAPSILACTTVEGFFFAFLFKLKILRSFMYQLWYYVGLDVNPGPSVLTHKACWVKGNSEERGIKMG